MEQVIGPWCEGVEPSPCLDMDSVSPIYSIPKPGIELGLSSILRLHTYYKENDAMTHG
jgi:hypothetical protein